VLLVARYSRNLTRKSRLNTTMPPGSGSGDESVNMRPGGDDPERHA